MLEHYKHFVGVHSMANGSDGRIPKTLKIGEVTILDVDVFDVENVCTCTLRTPLTFYPLN
jgi:hypothetical protein